MFHTAVPVSLSTIPDTQPEAVLEKIFAKLSDVGADRVFLCPRFPDHLEEKCEKLRRLVPLFRERGIAVGVWVSSLYHVTYDGMGFSHAVDLDGSEKTEFTCPTDERFTDYYASLMKTLASCGADTIMMDDDFRVNFNGRKPMCFCRKHMAYMESVLGRKVTGEELREKLLTGACSEERQAWMAANGHFLMEMVKKIRTAVDEVNPALPVTLASGPASWGADGYDVQEILTVLNGKKRVPFRLSGGPYWPMFFPGIRLANVIDIHRSEAALCRRLGVEGYAEGDTYPRPRYEVPASQLELFELAARADGNCAGILKYVMDYAADVDYECGYIHAAAANRGLYDEVERIFGGKTAVGFDIYTPFAYAENLIGSPEIPSPDIESRAMDTPAIRMANDLSLPTRFDGVGPVIVFGGDAQKIPMERLCGGAVLDLTAAKCLMKRGVDVGIREIGTFGKTVSGGPLAHQNALQLWPDDVRHAPMTVKGLANLKPAPGAETVTRYTRGEEVCGGELRYENAAGQRFFILPFDAAENVGNLGLMRNYYRQKEFVEAYTWLAGKPPEAICTGCPDLYLMVKKRGGELAVGLWNLSGDAVEAPVITLGEAYSKLETVHCSGTLDDRTVTLSRLPSQEFCCFVVRK